MTPPNIVFILIDDLGCRDLGCYGSTFYETPCIDRLVASGMRFENAYASCPVCSPTRASILSGKYPARIGLTQWIGGNAVGKLLDVPYLHYLPLEETSIATVLRGAGYQTWHVGKWHLGDGPFYPEQHGFDHNFGGCHYGAPGPGGYFSPYGRLPIPAGPEGEYLTDRLTDEAIDLIRRRGDRPFFLNLWHYAVHTPIDAPPALVQKYADKARRLGLDQVNPFVGGEFHPCQHKSHERVQRRMIQSDIHYAAMIENLDYNVGRLLDTLESAGIADNTLIVFTSDNGGLATSEGSPTCNLPYIEGKGWNYEGGTRVCQSISWPGIIPGGSRSEVPVTSTDFYPTFLEAAGLPLMPEQHCDGESLIPLLTGTGKLRRQAVFWHYPHYSNQGGAPAAAMVAGDWKLIEFYEDNSLALFNLRLDPSEQYNQADAQPARCHEMHARLKQWQQELGAAIPQENPDYQPRRPKTPNNAME